MTLAALCFSHSYATCHQDQLMIFKWTTHTYTHATWISSYCAVWIVAYSQISDPWFCYFSERCQNYWKDSMKCMSSVHNDVCQNWAIKWNFFHPLKCNRSQSKLENLVSKCSTRSSNFTESEGKKKGLAEVWNKKSGQSTSSYFE